MVHGTYGPRVTVFPTVAPRIKTTRARTTPVFSVASQLKPATVASVKKPPAAPVAATPAPASQSQVNNAATDFRQLFSGLPATTSAQNTTPVNPPFVPTFRTATVTDGTTVWGLNHDYFASKDTAQWIANKYGTGQVIETPFEGSGGPFAGSANEYQIKLADGRMVNAGILAGYYERNPEGQFPGLADKLIRGQLGLA